MNQEQLIGKEIEIKRLGKSPERGTVERYEENTEGGYRMYVRWHDRNEVGRVAYPDSFESRVTVVDESLLPIVRSDIEEYNAQKQARNQQDLEKVTQQYQNTQAGQAAHRRNNTPNNRREIINITAMTEEQIKETIKKHLKLKDYSIFYNECLSILQSEATQAGLTPSQLDEYYTLEKQVLIGEEFQNTITNEIKIADVTVSKEVVKTRLQTGEFVRINNIRRLFLKLLFHSVNNYRRRDVVDFIANYSAISRITDNFNVDYVKEKTQEEITNEVLLGLGRDGDTIKDFAKTIKSAAQFLSGFTSFDEFVTTFQKYGNAAASKIDVFNIGFAMGCDFLKETDSKFDIAKPDTHIIACIKQFADISVFPRRYQDYIVSLACSVIQEEINNKTGAGISVYKLDKILYLICTKDFYLHKKNLRNTHANNQRRERFIRQLREKGIIE